MAGPDRKKQVRQVVRLLRKEYPEPATALEHRNPFELLAATILSAQTTDAHVNKVTRGLFRKYPSVKAFAEAPPEELERDLSSINFYRNKARSIRGAARKIREDFGGKVPASMEELVTLPGVARKTANIILWNAYGRNEGVAVDTHVKRLSKLLGLTEHEDPVKIERDLMDAAPRKDWGDLSHLLILHGRSVCVARRPQHEECVLRDICPSKDI